MLLMVLFAPDAAVALDPSRALTQCIHRIWQAQQGLLQPTVNCVRQTQDGYLWLGTRSGLVRFDGVQFTRIRDHEQTKLEDAWIHDLQEDAEHNLWIATDGAGLIRLTGDETTRFGVAQGLPSDIVRCVLIDSQCQLWAGTVSGLARFTGGKFVAFGDEQGLPRFDVHALCQDSDGTLWVGGDRGQLWRSSGDTFSAQPLSSLSSGDTVHALLGSQDGALWVGTSRGLIRRDAAQERWITTADGLADNLVLCLAPGHDNSLWIGTKDGFSRLRGDDVDSFRTADGLSQSTVYAICEDHEGSLWIGTKHGLNQFVDRRTIPFTASEGLPSNNTGPIFQDRAGTIWVGTLDAGLARFDGRRFSAVNSKQAFSKTIYALADSQQGGLWIGTDKGLCRMQDDAIVASFTTAEGLPSDTVRSLCQDQAGTLWIGTAGGLAALRDGRIDKTPAGDGRDALPILAILDCGEFLLVSTQGGGIYRCAQGKLEPYPLVDGSLADVDAFYRDTDGRLWMGTRGAGLLLVDGEHSYRFTSKDGLYDDDIFGITADDQDRLWMGCSKGIFSVPRGDLQAFASGTLEKIETTAFTPLDALRTIECQEGIHPGVQKMRDGRIWLSTIHGLIVVDPTHLQRQLPPTAVVIEELVVNGVNENPQRVRSLGPGNANVTFQYAALSYASPSRITFRYRLEGFDKDWVDAGNRREAFYTNLAPGKYQFSVIAKNVDGKEYETASPLAFSITPHFYQATWFLPLCVVVLAAAGWSIYNLRVRQIRERLHVVLAERSRIARELHDTLMQGFSGVTMEMQALASQLNDSTDKDTLVDIIQDAGNCLREARRSVAGLRGDQPGLAASLAQAARQLTETNDVHLKLQLDHVSRRFPTDVEYHLLRIAQEGISNAVKHSGARNIEVALDDATDELRLSIKDDGTGFAAGADAPLSAGHYGLIGMRERARQIGADLQLESVAGRGTSICIVLPLVSANLKSPA